MIRRGSQWVTGSSRSLSLFNAPLERSLPHPGVDYVETFSSCCLDWKS
jgi:hypothetical protein